MNDGQNSNISYGKLYVPLHRVHAEPMRGLNQIPESPFTGKENTLFGCEVSLEVFGENFLPAYTKGDNRQVVATDTMKNFILRRALDFEGATLESFLDFLGRDFMETYPVMQSIRISGCELRFDPVQVQKEGGFGKSDLLFSRCHDDHAVASLDFSREDGKVVLTGHRSGRQDLWLLKIKGSSFIRFSQDEYTSLPERGDRPLYIHMDVFWRYTNLKDILSADLSEYVSSEQVRDLVDTVFHEFVSESIQHLVHEMAQRLLKRFPQLAEVSFRAENHTREPVAVAEDGSERAVYTNPFPAYGLITLTMDRQNVHSPKETTDQERS